MRRSMLVFLAAGALFACSDTRMPTEPPGALDVGRPHYGAFPGANGKIVFVRDGYGLWLMNGDGSGLEQLTAEGINPSWSADGTKIAFSGHGDGDVYDIYVINADGSGRVQLTDDATNDFQPSWSPDGSRIAFQSYRDGNPEIYVMDADGSNPVRLTNDLGTDASPAWSPDGSRIAFGSDRTGSGEIYVMDADGSNLTDLTNSAEHDYDPQWSPDGSRIVFGRFDPYVQDVFVMNADGSGQTNVSNDAGTAATPSWSPDGTKIVFTSLRDGNGEIYVMDANGSNQTRLTDYAGQDNQPDWQPIPQDEPATDVRIDMLAETQRAGKTVLYRIVVFNDGPDDVTAQDVTVTDVLPAEARFLAVSTMQGSCSAPAAGSSGTVVCALGSLEVGSTEIEITVKVFPPKSHPSNTATVSSSTPDPDLSNNSVTVTTP